MSHILSAIKTDTAIAQGSVLMTLSKYNDDNDIDYVLANFRQLSKDCGVIAVVFLFY